ncbi:unnamed protein product [Closterium sp. NIES-54]
MEVDRTSMIHAAAPHFLWPFAVQYATHQINNGLSVSQPGVSPTLLWMGEVGDASPFRFYHPATRRVLSSQDVTFDELVWYYRLYPHRSWPAPPLPLFLVPSPPKVYPLLPCLAPSGVLHVTPLPSVVPSELSSDSSGPVEVGGPASDDIAASCRPPRLEKPPGFTPWSSLPPLQPIAVHPRGPDAVGGGDAGGTGSRSADSGGAEGPLVGGVKGTAAGGSGGPTAGGAGGAGAGARGAGARGAGAGARGAGARGAGVLTLEPEVLTLRLLVVLALEVFLGLAVLAFVLEELGLGVRHSCYHGGRYSGSSSRRRHRYLGQRFTTYLVSPCFTEATTFGTTPPLLFPPHDLSLALLPPDSPLPAPARYLLVTDSLTERREPMSHATSPVTSLVASPVARVRRARRARPPPVPSTHTMALHPSSVSQSITVPLPPQSSLPVVLESESDLAHAASPIVTRCLATLVPREWHDRLKMTLAALGFTPSTADPSLFLRTDLALPVFYIPVYVDGLVFATADSKALACVKAKLQKTHTCTDLGELRSYLGLQITQNRAAHTITLTRSYMVQRVLMRFSFQFSSVQPTPLPTSQTVSAPSSDEFVEPSDPYADLVGCLIYLMTWTPPDHAYPLNIMAGYVALGRALSTGGLLGG